MCICNWQAVTFFIFGEFSGCDLGTVFFSRLIVKSQLIDTILRMSLNQLSPHFSSFLGEDALCLLCEVEFEIDLHIKFDVSNLCIAGYGVDDEEEWHWFCSH